MNWTGGANDQFSSDFYFEWTDEAFYIAAVVNNDTTPKYGADAEAWVGKGDCIQLAIEPSNTKTSEANKQWFFTIGAKENGDVVTYRHNFGADGDITSNVTAKSSGHKADSKSYTIEAKIPWSVMKVDGAPEFTIKQGAEMPMMVCILDTLEDGTSLVALKSDDFDNAWAPSGLGTLKLTSSTGKSSKKSNPKTGTISVITYLALASAGASGAVISRKRKKN